LGKRNLAPLETAAFDRGEEALRVVSRRRYAVADGRRNGRFRMFRYVVEIYFGGVVVLAVAPVVGFYSVAERMRVGACGTAAVFVADLVMTAVGAVA